LLDFYLIQDTFEKPEFPEESRLEFAGGLEDKTFADLKRYGLINNEISFYSDFRLSENTVKEIFDLSSKEFLSADTSVKKFKDILTKAITNNSGLIAYCD